MSAGARLGPRFVLLGNGRVAREFLEGLAEPAALPELVVLNQPDRQREGEAIRAVCERQGIPVAEWSPETREGLLARVRDDGGCWLLSVYFGHLLDAALLDAAGGRALNLHPSLLPWSQGVHTNVWPIVEGSPAGVTLHAMVQRVDAGAVVVQVPVPVEPWDTGGTLYAKLEAAALGLLRGSWPERALAAWPGMPQEPGGSRHRVADLRALDEFDLEGSAEARAFFDLLRARSFPPFPGLRLRVGGRVVEATVTLREIVDE